MSNIFVDTWFWVAFADHSDNYYKSTVALMESWMKQKQKLTTSNFVLDETFSKIRKRQGISRLKSFRQVLSQISDVLHVERVTVDDEENVWKWFLYDWRELSYTDCTSFAIMKRLSLLKVATNDQHFEMAGFEMVK